MGLYRVRVRVRVKVSVSVRVRVRVVARAQYPRERHAGAVGEREAGHAQCRSDPPVGLRVGAASAPTL